MKIKIIQFAAIITFSGIFMSCVTTSQLVQEAVISISTHTNWYHQ